MDVLTPLLPDRYAPLRENGSGIQSIYLTVLPEPLAAALIDLLGAEAHSLVRGHRVAEEASVQTAKGLYEWEEHELNVVRTDTSMPETEREAVVLARRGQGLFRQRVMEIERSCRVTKVNREEHLRASHCKPWRDATNEERLNGENGLLLTPTIDHLFDRGFIGFDENGDLLVSPVAHRESLVRMGIDPSRAVNVGRFSEGQRRYLAYHREYVLLRSSFLAR
jgi:hypothetical protein